MWDELVPQSRAEKELLMTRSFAALSAAVVALLTASGYLVIWSFLWPFGLQNHVGDLPFASYVGYGLDVLGQNPLDIGICVFLMLTALVAFLGTAASNGFNDLSAAKDSEVGFFCYSTYMFAAYASGVVRRTILPAAQWTALVLLLLLLASGASQYGASMANNLVRGKDVGAASGVSILRSDDVKADNAGTLPRGDRYVVVWTNSDGVYVSPLQPKATDIRTMRAYFIPKEHLNILGQSREFVGTCKSCLAPRQTADGSAVLLVIVILAVSLIMYSGIRDYAVNRMQRGAITQTSFWSIPFQDLHLVHQTFLLERLRRGEKLRLTIREASKRSVYFIDPSDLEHVTLLTYSEGPTPNWMAWIESRLAACAQWVTSLIGRLRPGGGAGKAQGSSTP